jgi:lactate dehydrogenase-like 2-hydroxyacid dehydrogenase
MQIVVLDADTMGGQQELELLAKLAETKIYGGTSADDTIKNIGNADIVVTNKVELTADILAKCPSVRLVCITATGMNNIDIEAADRLKIQVKNAKAYSTNSVAQHTLACLLYLNSKLPYYHKYVASGNYSKGGSFTHLGPSFNNLHGKTFGIIGLGAIGRRVAQLADAFGCKICYYSTTGKNSTPDYQRLPLEDLLSASDYVSIHAPLTDATRKLIAGKQLKQMKPTALLLNMGRGGIICEADLAKALISGTIAGACLDVLEHEPLPENSPLFPLLESGKLLITPHIAWASAEARKRLMEITAQNIKLFMSQNPV